jgi:hypothetical protein
MEQRAFAAFRDAVHDLSDEPTLTNVHRYLAASRALARSSPKADGRAGGRRPRSSPEKSRR